MLALKKHIILPIAILLCISCTGDVDIPSPLPERELSVPEKVEKEISGALSKDWKSLADTLEYFNSQMLSKGRFRGKAPDGVHYELRISLEDKTSISVVFKVEDSVFVSVNGSISPLEVTLSSQETEIGIKKETPDSTSLSISKVKATGPDRFFLDDSSRAVLYYEDRQVGYIVWEEFENPDYSTGKYPVVHYYNDPRTFTLYDGR